MPPSFKVCTFAASVTEANKNHFICRCNESPTHGRIRHITKIKASVMILLDGKQD
jgi:hypothetical protein